MAVTRADVATRLLTPKSRFMWENSRRTTWQKDRQRKNFSNGKGVGLRTVEIILNQSRNRSEYTQLYPIERILLFVKLLKGKTQRGRYQQNDLLLQSAAIPSHNIDGIQGLQVDELYFVVQNPFAANELLWQIILLCSGNDLKTGYCSTVLNTAASLSSVFMSSSLVTDSICLYFNAVLYDYIP